MEIRSAVLSRVDGERDRDPPVPPGDTDPGAVSAAPKTQASGPVLDETVITHANTASVRSRCCSDIRPSFRSMTDPGCRGAPSQDRPNLPAGCLTSRWWQSAVLGPLLCDTTVASLRSAETEAACGAGDAVLLRANQVGARPPDRRPLGLAPLLTRHIHWTRTSPASERRSATGGSRGARPATRLGSTPASSNSSASTICNERGRAQAGGRRNCGGGDHALGSRALAWGCSCRRHR